MICAAPPDGSSDAYSPTDARDRDLGEQDITDAPSDAPEAECEAGAWGDGGSFPCGTLTCADYEYCDEEVGDHDGNIPAYSCVPIPACCAGNATCACINPFCIVPPAHCDDSTGHVFVICH